MTHDSMHEDDLETQPLLNPTTLSDESHPIQANLEPLPNPRSDLPRYNETVSSLTSSPTSSLPPNSVLHNYIIVNELPTSTATFFYPSHSLPFTTSNTATYGLPIGHRSIPPPLTRKPWPAWSIFLSIIFLFILTFLFAFLFIYPSFFTLTIWQTRLDDSVPTPLRLQLLPPRVMIYTVSDVDLYNPLIFPLDQFQFKVQAYYPRFNPPLLLGQSTEWINLHVPARSTATVHVPMLLTLTSLKHLPLVHVVMKLLEECKRDGSLLVDTYANITLSKNKIWNELTFQTQRKMHVPCH